MSALIPVGATEMNISSLPEQELAAIKAVLQDRGVAKGIKQLWWDSINNGYYVLIDTKENEPGETHFMSLITVAAKQTL